MKKTSKTQASQHLLQSLNVNSSLQNWGFNNRYQNNKMSLHQLSHCYSYGSDLAQSHTEAFQPISVNQSNHSFSKSQPCPNYKHIIVVPQVSKSISQYKEGSQLSLQLNQISRGFNKENKRIQDALFQIRETSVKKENERFLKSISLSKKSQTSKKTHSNNADHSIIKSLNFQNLVQKRQLKKENFKDSKPLTKLKKKNLYELMKQQRNMIKTLGSNLRSA